MCWFVLECAHASNPCLLLGHSISILGCSLLVQVLAHLQCEHYKPDLDFMEHDDQTAGNFQDTYRFLSHLCAGTLEQAAIIAGQQRRQQLALVEQGSERLRATSKARKASKAAAKVGRKRKASQEVEEPEMAGGRHSTKNGHARDPSADAVPQQVEQREEPERDLGVLLWGFLDRFGNRTDYNRQAVSIHSGGFCSKLRSWQERPRMLAVEDPQEMGKDIGSGSFNFAGSWQAGGGVAASGDL